MTENAQNSKICMCGARHAIARKLLIVVMSPFDKLVERKQYVSAAMMTQRNASHSLGRLGRSESLYNSTKNAAMHEFDTTCA
jgi:hypothetical protein